MKYCQKLITGTKGTKFQSRKVTITQIPEDQKKNMVLSTEKFFKIEQIQNWQNDKI